MTKSNTRKKAKKSKLNFFARQKKLRLILFVVIFACLGGFAIYRSFAATVTISGTVYDTNGIGLAGVRVAVCGGPTITTDSSGHYSVSSTSQLFCVRVIRLPTALAGNAIVATKTPLEHSTTQSYEWQIGGASCYHNATYCGAGKTGGDNHVLTWDVNSDNIFNFKVVNYATSTPPISPCLQRGTVFPLNGEGLAQLRPASPNNLTFDATNAAWNSSSAGNYPIIFDQNLGNLNLCLYKGNISGFYDENTIPWTFYHNITGVTVHTPNMTIDSLRIHNYGDGISFSSGNSAAWTIRNSYISHSHDDCIQNDYMQSGLIYDSLLESCFSILSERASSTQNPKPDGRSRVLTIKNSLLGIYAIKPVFSPDKYPSPGHSGIFKWATDPTNQGYSTKIALSNVTIRLDGRKPNTQDYNIPTYTDSFGNQVSYLASCSNVTIVWGGTLVNGEPFYSSGPYAGQSAKSQFTNWPAGCMTLTADQSKWTNAVVSWKLKHPGV